MDRYDEAIAELALGNIDETTLLRGELASVRFLSFALTGRSDDARNCQRDARAFLFSVDAPSLELELRMNEAKFAFVNDEREQARRIAVEVASPNSARFFDRSGVIGALNVSADADNLLAALALGNDERAAAVDHYIRSLKLARRSTTVDVGLIARILSNLSGSLEGIDVQLERHAVGMIRNAYEALEWTGDLAIQQFHIIRELGFASALHGDHLSAFREYKRAFNVAPKAELRLQALLDRVFLGIELKQHLVAHADLLEAQELAEIIDWSRVDERDFSCIPTLAKLLAPIDLPAAKATLRTFTDRKTKSTRTSSLFTDKRFHAEYLSAVAAIAKAEGNDSEHERSLASAFEIYVSVGSNWRAAQVAYDLRTCVDAKYEAFAHREACKHPNSWLAAKLASSSA